MNKEESNYLSLLSTILNDGNVRDDRTGVGTHGLFGTQLRFSLEDGKIPMLTTKKMFVKGVVEELLFFLRGESDTKILEAKGVKIWKGNTTKEFLNKRGLAHLREGNMGKMYGKQWRDWGGNEHECLCGRKGVDQISQAINLLKTDPFSRRIVVSALNVEELPEMCLHPCHPLFQFYVQDGKLSCLFFMRSVDMFLGFPFNVLSYAILTHIIAKTVGMTANELIFMAGDSHLYKNHKEQVKLQVSRTPYEFPTLKINKELSTIEDIEKLVFEDFQIEGYQCHPAIKAKMAV